MRTQQSSVNSELNEIATSRNLNNAADIVQCIKEGNSEAESELIRKYQRGLRFMIRNHTNDDELAKDLVQETFIVVIQRLRSKSIFEPAKLSSFLHRTARNIMIGHIRKTSRRRTDANSEVIDRTEGTLESPDTAAIRDQEAVIVRQLLKEMRCERDRQILLRFYLLEQEKLRICEDLELSEVHFNRVLYRARQRFGVIAKEYDRVARSRLLKK